MNILGPEKRHAPGLDGPHQGSAECQGAGGTWFYRTVHRQHAGSHRGGPEEQRGVTTAAPGVDAWCPWERGRPGGFGWVSRQGHGWHLALSPDLGALLVLLGDSSGLAPSLHSPDPFLPAQVLTSSPPLPTRRSSARLGGIGGLGGLGRGGKLINLPLVSFQSIITA